MRKTTETHPEPLLTFPAPARLSRVTIILVEPAVPGNIGASARAMKTMGLTRLTVLGGARFRDDFEAMKMGHGAGDVMEGARSVSTWEEAVDGLHWLVGTTHRKRRAQFPQILDVREAAVKIAELSGSHHVGIVFGREESGLTDAELRRCQTIATVPSGAAYPALNLAQAVQVVGYEIFRAALGAIPPPRYQLATVAEIERVMQHLDASLRRIGFRPHHGDSETFLRALRRVLSRAPLEKRDCNVIHRICQQIDYHVRQAAGR